jgi:hypothetical protein
MLRHQHGEEDHLRLEGKIVADRKAAPNRPKYWGRCSTMDCGTRPCAPPREAQGVFFTSRA